MSDVTLWQHTVAGDAYIEMRLGTDGEGAPVIEVVAYAPDPSGTPVYVDVPFEIGDHTEVYRVHALYVEGEALQFSDVEELTP